MLDQAEFDRWCRMAFDAADTADGQIERAPLHRDAVSRRAPGRHTVSTLPARRRRAGRRRRVIEFVDRQWSLLMKDAEETGEGIDAE